MRRFGIVSITAFLAYSLLLSGCQGRMVEPPSAAAALTQDTAGEHSSSAGGHAHSGQKTAAQAAETGGPNASAGDKPLGLAKGAVLSYPSSKSGKSGSARSAGFKVVKGSGIAMKDISRNMRLNHLTFINEQDGWMVKSAGYPSSDSRVEKTTDGGNTWSALPVKGYAAQDIAFANADKGWMTAQSDCNLENGIVGCAKEDILATGDGGKTWRVQWSKTGSHVPGGNPGDIKAVDAEHVYAVMDGRLMLTSDGGKSWSAASTELAGFRVLKADFVSSDTGWIIGNQFGKRDKSGAPSSCTLTVLKTGDFGSSWSRQFGKTVTQQTLGAAGIDFTDPQHGFFLVTNIDTWDGGFYATTDGGRHWTKVNHLKSVRPTPSKLDFITDQLGWIPLDAGAGPIAGGLLITRDGGKSFSLVQKGYQFTLHDSFLVSDNEGWAIGSNPNRGDYLIHTKDGGMTWTQVYPKVHPLNHVHFISAKVGFGFGDLSNPNAVLRSQDGGKSWSLMYTFDGKYRIQSLSFRDARHGWALTSPSRGKGDILLWKTSNGGKTWVSSITDLSSLNPYSSELYFKVFDAKTALFATAGNKQMTWEVTKDGGKSWNVHRAPGFANGGITRFSFVSPALGWAYSEGGKANGISLLKLGADGKWTSLGKPSADGYAAALMFSNATTGWMLYQAHAWTPSREWRLMITADGGQTWTDHAFPAKANPDGINPSLSFADARHGWLETGSGLYASSDSGLTWSLLPYGG